MNILKYRNDTSLSSCARAYLATGIVEHDEFNRTLLKKNQTGNWIVAPGRVRIGDGFFMLLPNVNFSGGYPRQLYAGVVNKMESIDKRTLFTVKKFVRLPDVEEEVKRFLLERTPPTGNRILEIWNSNVDSDARSTQFASEVQKARMESSARRQSRLAKAPRLPARVAVTTEVFIRNPDVVAEVLYQANGVCGECGNRAPFTRKSDGSPYLEVHHRVQLALNGEDTVANAIALCPNCHREKHHGQGPV